ncbi:MAG: Crp/Fnr family transcriptional regulator [Magnetococcales bacterium]|nr:Crp/Fnr family transcriptional regulator [Magnetococcales bacterium]
MPRKAAVDVNESVIKMNTLFAALTEAQFKIVWDSMRVVQLGNNQNLFDTNTTANRFFILTKGQIKLFRLSQNGMEKVVKIINPGEDFASAVMFMEARRYPLSADALKESVVLSFDNQKLLAILRESPDTCFRMMAKMSSRLCWQLSEIDRLSLQSAPVRLVTFLLDHVKIQGNSGSVCLESPKRVIASRLSIQPETFSRILRKLTHHGLIQVKGLTIFIPDVQALTIFSEETD